MNKNKLHNCTPDSRIFLSRDAGPAISFCVDDGGGCLWASGGGYTSQVNFCPFCGYKARVQVIWLDDTLQPDRVVLKTAKSRITIVNLEKE